MAISTRKEIALLLIMWCLAATAVVQGEDVVKVHHVGPSDGDGSTLLQEQEPAAAAAYDAYGKPEKHMFYETLGQAQGHCSWCSCRRQLTYEILNSQNGCMGPDSCVQPGPWGYGNYCSGSGTKDLCGCFEKFYELNNVAFCVSTAPLCVKAECPRSGEITIKAEAVESEFPTIFPDCCYPPDTLYVYRGDYNSTAVSASPNVLAWDQRVVDITVDCARGEVFTVCEKDGFLLLDRISFTFSTLNQNVCPAGYTVGVCSP